MAPLAGYCGYQDCYSCVDNLCFFVEFLNRTFLCEPSIENLDNVRDWVNTTSKCPSSPSDQDDQDCMRFDLLGSSLFILFLGLGIGIGWLVAKIFKMPGQYDRLREMNFEAWRQRGAHALTWIRLAVRWLGICQRFSTCCIRVGEGLIDNEVHAEDDPAPEVQGPRRPLDPLPPPPPPPALSPPPQQQQQQAPIPENRSSSSSSSTASSGEDQDAPEDNVVQDQEANVEEIVAAAGNIAGNLPLPTGPSTSTPLLPRIQGSPSNSSQRLRPCCIPVAIKPYGSLHSRPSSANAESQQRELRRSSRPKNKPKRLSYTK